MPLRIAATQNFWLLAALVACWPVLRYGWFENAEFSENI
jgi:hypothetical protein